MAETKTSLRQESTTQSGQDSAGTASVLFGSIPWDEIRRSLMKTSRRLLKEGDGDQGCDCDSDRDCDFDRD